MFWYFLPIILLNQKLHPIPKEEKEITVKTFYDYKHHMINKDDVLKITIPRNTFIFISASEGYKATIYKSKNFGSIVDELVPSSIRRLIYFAEEGSMKVTSTIPDIWFSFHSLPIDKISSKKYNLVVSSDLYQKFIFTETNKHFDLSQFKNLEDTLFWLISDQTYSCKLEGNMTYYISNDNEADENDIPSNEAYYNNSESVTGRSKLFLFHKMALYNKIYNINSTFDGIINSNYYSHYRTYVNKTSLQGTKIIERGKDDFYVDYYHSFEDNDGFFSIDFSITRKVYINSNSLILFLTKANVEINDPNDEIVSQYLEQMTQLVSKSQPITETEMNYTFFIYSSGVSNTYYTTNPSSFFKVGSIFNKVVNYTNDIYPVTYIVPSLQNILTQIYAGSFYTLYEIKYGHLEEKNFTSSTNVTGPFLITIPKKHNYTFYTYYESEYNEDYIDIHQFLVRDEKSRYFSKKYGVFDIVDISNDYSDTKYYKLFIFDALRIKSKNLVYIKSDTWKGEIIDPVLPANEREFGPHLGKRFFYVYNSPDEFKSCTFMIYNNGEDSFRLCLAQTYSHKCDKIIAFNEYPTSFDIRSKKVNDALYLAVGQTMCFFPLFVFSDYNCTEDDDIIFHTTTYGSGMSNSKMLAIKSLSEEMIANAQFFITERDLSENFYREFFDNERFNGDYKLYSEIEIKKTTNVYFVENKYPEPTPLETPYPEPEPETFDGEEYQISRNGYKYVDMNNRATFKIKCKNTTLLYIHNIDDINVEAYSNGELFGSINSTSFDRIIYFADDGEIIVTKSNNDNNANLQLFFSYIYPCLFDSVFVCSDPSTKVFVRRYNADADKINVVLYHVYGEGHYMPVYIWFTYPYETNIEVVKYLYNDHYISINGNNSVQIKDTISSITLKDALVTINWTSHKLGDEYYTRFNVRNLSNYLISEELTRYDIVRQLVEINKTHSSILLTKPHIETREPTSKPKEGIEEYLGIIVVVVCVVGGVIIIVVVVVVVVVKKRKKKKAQVSASLGENNEDDNENQNNENGNENDEELK